MVNKPFEKMIEKYNSELNFLILLFIINIIFCVLYFSVFNFNFSWDTVGYAAIGKIYFGYNEPFWAIKYYYSQDLVYCSV